MYGRKAAWLRDVIRRRMLPDGVVVAQGRSIFIDIDALAQWAANGGARLVGG